jgi:hypothetical protein
MILLAAPAGARAPDPADVAATHAYLEARYQLATAEGANAPAAAALAQNAAASLGGECAGVLTGAPSDTLFEAFHAGPVSPRRMGELRRQGTQTNAIRGEANGVVFSAFHAQEAAAEQAFTTTVTALRWTDPRIAERIRAEATERAPETREASPVACADMRVWAASGFRSVAPHTRALIEQTRRVLESISGSGEDVETLLRPFESKADDELILRTAQAEFARFKAFSSVSETVHELDSRLGLSEPKPPAFKPPRRLGHGKTQGGATFTITKEDGLGHEVGCRLEVGVEFEHTTRSELGISSGGGGGNVCVAGRSAQRTSHLQGCVDGLLTITAATPGATSVRLSLANGHTITSRTVFISKREGGPAWVYAQALGRKSSRPVTLTELDSHGRTVAVVRLRPRARCPVESEAPPVRFPVARGTAPDGRSFVIEAFAATPGGEAQLTLSLDTPEEGQNEAVFTGSSHREFQPQIAHECPPHEFGLVYGQLRSPATSVEVRTAAGLQILAKVAVPPAVHAAGQLAYGIVTSPPLEVIVLGLGGRTLFTESLAKRAAEEREFCEGYAEP